MQTRTHTHTATHPASRHDKAELVTVSPRLRVIFTLMGDGLQRIHIAPYLLPYIILAEM